MKKINFLLCFLYIHYFFIIAFIFELVKYTLYNYKEYQIDFFGIEFFNLYLSYSESTMYYIFIILLLSTVTFFVLLIINYKSVLKDFHNNEIKLLCKKVKRIKISFIPFWVINFILIIILIFHIDIFFYIIENFNNFYTLTIWYYLL